MHGPYNIKFKTILASLVVVLLHSLYKTVKMKNMIFKCTVCEEVMLLNRRMYWTLSVILFCINESNVSDADSAPFIN
jgi:hypothetical protein